MSLPTALRWPASWTQPSALDLLRGTPVNLILLPESGSFDAIRARARELGIATGAPSEVVIVPGVWPGVKSSRGGDAEAGPTGAAWVDSNGWAIRLARAQHPGKTIWVDAPPKDRSVYSGSGSCRWIRNWQAMSRANRLRGSACFRRRRGLPPSPSGRRTFPAQWSGWSRISPGRMSSWGRNCSTCWRAPDSSIAL